LVTVLVTLLVTLRGRVDRRLRQRVGGLLLALRRHAFERPADDAIASWVLICRSAKDAENRRNTPTPAS
jgi:hypothetical protein